MTEEDFSLLRVGDKIINHETGLVYAVLRQQIGGGAYDIILVETAANSEEWGKY